MSSRDLILRRVRAALADVPRDEDADAVAVERAYLYRARRSEARRSCTDLLAENLADYRARVYRCDEADVSAARSGGCWPRPFRAVC